MLDTNGILQSIKIRTFWSDETYDCSPAIYSEDRPLEFWRNFPDFRE